MAKITKKKSTVKETTTLKNSKHATTRASKKQEKQLVNDEEEEEENNEDIVVVVNTKKTMVRNNKINEHTTNKVVGKVNNLDPNVLHQKKSNLNTLSKTHPNGEKFNTSSVEDSESGTESNLDQLLSQKSPTLVSKAIINTKGCIDWELNNLCAVQFFLNISLSLVMTKWIILWKNKV